MRKILIAAAVAILPIGGMQTSSVAAEPSAIAARMIELTLGGQGEASSEQVTEGEKDVRLKQVGEELARLNGGPLARLEVLKFFRSTRWRFGMWDSGLIARLRALTPDTVAEWTGGINKALPGSVQSYNVIGILVRTDRLFSDARFNPAESQTLLRRLEALPLNAAAQWRKKSKGREGDPAVAIALIDELFHEGLFQTAVFQAALPLAEARAAEWWSENKRKR